MIEDCPIIKVQNISQFTSEELVNGESLPWLSRRFYANQAVLTNQRRLMSFIHSFVLLLTINCTIYVLWKIPLYQNYKHYKVKYCSSKALNCWSTASPGIKKIFRVVLYMWKNWCKSKCVKIVRMGRVMYERYKNINWYKDLMSECLRANIFRPFGPQFGLKIRGGEGAAGPSPGSAPALPSVTWFWITAF